MNVLSRRNTEYTKTSTEPLKYELRVAHFRFTILREIVRYSLNNRNQTVISVRLLKNDANAIWTIGLPVI